MIHLKIDLLIQGDSNHTETKSLCINNSSQNLLIKSCFSCTIGIFYIENCSDSFRIIYQLF